MPRSARREPGRPPLPAEFAQQYEAERAKKLRRRAMFLCVMILVLVGFSWVMFAFDTLMPGYLVEEDSYTWAETVFDALFTLEFGAALVYFKRSARSRAQIVRGIQALLAVAGITLVVIIPLVMAQTNDPDYVVMTVGERTESFGFSTAGTMGLLHLMASVLIALSWREGLVAVLPMVAAYCAWVLGFAEVNGEQTATMLISIAIATAPGFAYSVWRHSSFAQRFYTRAIHQRYASVTRELTHAQQVHEALFPPPITRGPVRVNYSYEPMHAIGGDFLFVRPVSFPPSEPAGPVLVMLIDVTGHGIAAALAVNRLHAELERLASTEAVASPAAMLCALNAFAHHSLAPRGMYATAMCLRITPGASPAEPGLVEWAGAGHPPALHRNGPRGVVRLDSESPMLGVLAADLFSCHDQAGPISPGDSVIAYTDGAVEARGADGGELGIKGLAALLAGVTAAPSARAGALAAGVDAHREGPAGDDILIVEVALVESA